MGFQVFVHLILVFAIRGVVAATVEECRTMRCSNHGPEIRFPFQLKDRQPEHCGLPGFQIFCHRGKASMEFQFLENTSLPGIQLFTTQEVHVLYLDYETKQIDYEIINIKLKLVHALTSSSSAIAPFPLGTKFDDNATCVSCSSRVATKFYPPAKMVTSLGRQSFPVYCFLNSLNISQLSITSCTMVFSSSIPHIDDRLNGLLVYLNSWLGPNCGKCEAKGEYCKLKNSSISNIEPADNSTICLPRGRGNDSIKPIAGIIPGATLVALVLTVLLYYLIRSHRQKKYDELKIEMFLANYQAMKPTRYSYADIKKITSNFSDKLGQGGYGSVYKGQITSDIIVAVKVLNSDPKANGGDFINEVGTLGRIYHVNVVRLVGYCADGCNRALVYEFQPNNSLEKFKYSGQNHSNNFLGWEKMQGITLGIAKGIEYLHQGCSQQILHFDIKPHNILLDHNFNPKISDFGLAKLCSRDQSIVSMTMARGTIGYIAPEVFSRNFGKVSSKSDVYSFGMLLLEMVGARNNNSVENNTETYFPEWIYHRLEEGGEVAIEIEKEEDLDIAKKLTIVGLWCIGWHPVDRPSMKHVIQMLESQECPTMPPNPFGTSSARSFTNDLQVIFESE